MMNNFKNDFSVPESLHYFLLFAFQAVNCIIAEMFKAGGLFN